MGRPAIIRSMPSAFAELYLEQQTALRENVDFFKYLPSEEGFGMVKKSLSERDSCTTAALQEDDE